jgi:hypothetical protein
MSNSRENVLTKHYSGKFGDQMVFRSRNGLSIMAKPPKKTLKDANESQLATRRKFKMASRWAKDALQNPATLAEYTAMASGMKSPYVMAVTNYLCPPKINGINVSRYAGEEGNKIEVLATDDFKLKCVTVKITDATGTLIEEGPCQENLSSDCWEYTVTVTVTSLTGVVVCAAATDIPDHTTSLVVTL